MITVGSLASGYGGLEMTLGYWLGVIDVRWHAESDPDASRVLKTRWPEVPNLGDFTMPGFWEGAERVDLMCGGIPCQPFSAAGRQQGAADARHLWPDWRQGIELHRPATVVFENVANLTRGKMRPIFDGIIADLLALGYDARWCLLGACAVGAAHHRHRVFLLACRTRTTPNAAQVTVQTCGQSHAAYLPTPSAVSYGSNRGGAAGRTGPVRQGCDALARLEFLPTPQHREGEQSRVLPNVETARARMVAGRRNLDDAIALLPTTAARDGSTRGEGGADFWERRRERGGVRSTAGVTLGAALVLLPTPRAADGAGDDRVDLRDRPNGSTLPTEVRAERWGKYAAAVARHADVMGALPPEPTEIGPKGGRRLAAAFSEWLMMLPAGHLTAVLDRNPALARAGNGVVPLQAATALQLLFADLVRR